MAGHALLEIGQPPRELVRVARIAHRALAIGEEPARAVGGLELLPRFVLEPRGALVGLVRVAPPGFADLDFAPEAVPRRAVLAQVRARGAEPLRLLAERAGLFSERIAARPVLHGLDLPAVRRLELALELLDFLLNTCGRISGERREPLLEHGRLIDPAAKIVAPGLEAAHVLGEVRGVAPLAQTRSFRTPRRTSSRSR